MARFKELAVAVAALVIEHTLIQVVIILVPIVAAVAFYKLPEFVIVAALSIGWSLSALLLVGWFRNHTRRRARRTLRIATSLYVNNVALLRPSITEENINTIIGALLRDLCEVIEYRVTGDRKAASFLLLDGERFVPFAMENYRDENLRHFVAHDLTKDNSFAGAALRGQKCICLPDSSKPKRYPWHQTPNGSAHHGRAAIPVQHNSCDIGVLCFDCEKVCKLSQDDVQLMGVYSAEIGMVWGYWRQLGGN